MITIDRRDAVAVGRSTLLHSVVFFCVLGLWWLSSAMVFASITPPSRSATYWWPALTLVAAVGTTVHAAREDWWRSTVRRLSLVGIAATCVVLATVAFFFVPVGLAGGLLAVAAVYLVCIPTALVAVYVAGWMAPRRRAASEFTLGLVLLLAVVVLDGEEPLGDAGLRFRFERAAANYELEALDIMRSGEGFAPGPDGSGRVVGVAEDGRTSVAWSWDTGIPARAAGPVFDPDGALDDPGSRFRSGVYEWSAASCRPFDGVWKWCAIY